MLQQYGRWNRKAYGLLWLLVAAGLLASVPLIADRMKMEQSSNQVEIVFDYRDLLEISEYKAEPPQFIDEQLSMMKEAGISALAVYESTLDELEMSGGVKLYSAEEAALLNGDEEMQRSNRTYVLFADERTKAVLEPVIREGFALYDISVGPWDYHGKTGLSIAAGSQEAMVIPLDPDPIQLALLRDRGFRIAVRLSDARPYDQDRMDALLGQLTEAGVDSIIFAGKTVTGFAEDRSKLALGGMAELIRKYNLNIAVIEQPPDKQQSGIAKLAYLSGYRAVRLHSILEEEAVNDAPVLADRFVLAVKDRNFRMLYLNASMKVDKEQGTVGVPLLNLYNSLKDPEIGVIKRIGDLGFTIGPPQPFRQADGRWDKLFKALACLGAIALIARMCGFFLPRLTLLIFLFGLGCSAALYVINSTLAVQALALLAAVSAPTIAVIIAVRRAESKLAASAAADSMADSVAVADSMADSVAAADSMADSVAVADSMADSMAVADSIRTFGWTLGLFLRTTAVSLIGAVFTVSLLNHISYILALNLFRGVSVLHVLPIVLAAVYVMFFHRTDTLREAAGRVKRFLWLNIRIVWVLVAAVMAAVLFYYMTRTGNQAVVSSYEKAFRALMENTLGARPRTKELLTHPLFIAGIYLLVRYKWRAALVLVAAGTMAQLSVVDTFAHLHTPLHISVLRVLYGMVISIVIALVYSAAWELLVRGWRRWQRVFQG